MRGTPSITDPSSSGQDRPEVPEALYGDPATASLASSVAVLRTSAST
jgi:hypothetical protein